MTDFQTRNFHNRSDLDSALADRLEQELALAHSESHTAHAVMLTGGSTPLPAYHAVGARLQQKHENGRANGNLIVLYTDERYVLADSAASNYYQSRPLLDALQLAPEQLLRVRTELPLKDAAWDYDQRLGQLLESGTVIGLGLLGLGADGHIASLFTEADLERAAGHLAIAVQRPDGMVGISVTPTLLQRVTEPLFVVTGEDKRVALDALLRQDPNSIAWRAVSGLASVEVWTAGV